MMSSQEESVALERVFKKQVEIIDSTGGILLFVAMLFLNQIHSLSSKLSRPRQ